MPSEYNPSANLSLDFNCEYSPPVGQVNVNFPDTPCSDLGDILSEEGSYVYVDLTDENTLEAWTGETLFTDLAIFKLLGEAIGYSGETGYFDNIIISRNFEIRAYEGSTLEQVLLSIRPAANLEPRIFNGENCYADIIKLTYLSFEYRSGETNDFELDAHPSFSIGFVLSESGESLLSIDLQTVITIPQDHFSGEHSTGSLITFPPVDLSTADARSGQTLDSISLFTHSLFNHTQYSGEFAQFDIDYIINEGSPSDSYSGEYTDVTLATQDALPFIGYSGEYADTDVSTEYTLELFAYHGQRSVVDLQLRSPILETANGYSGEYGLIPFINYTTTLSSFAYSGENSSVIFTTQPSPELLFLSYAGEFSETSMQVSQQIGQFSAFSGQYAEVIGLGFLENYRFISGDNAWVSLSTEVILRPDSYTGSNTKVDLAIKPSEGIGGLKASAGETLTIDTLKILQHHDLYVVFWHDTHVQIDMDSQTYFDLTIDSCCASPRVLQAQSIRIEMDFAEFPDQVHFGDRVIFQVDLSCRPRFNMTAFGGELMDIIDKTVYIAEDASGTPQMNFRSGEALDLVSFEAIFVHRLCKGFFIPSGNNIEIELTDVLDENCNVDRAYTGETMFALIHNTRWLTLKQYFGDRMIADLEVPTPWTLFSHSGERLWFDLATTIRQDGEARDGSNMFVRFYEPDWIAGDGQTASVTSIEFDVLIEFIDVGCLDNEFIYTNESGDPIPEKFESVPIELHPYQHDIKARCF